MKGLLVGRKVCECVEKFKVGNSGVTDNGWEYHFVVQNISASKYVDERELCANWDTVQNFELFFLFFFPDPPVQPENLVVEYLPGSNIYLWLDPVKIGEDLNDKDTVWFVHYNWSRYSL